MQCTVHSVQCTAFHVYSVEYCAVIKYTNVLQTKVYREDPNINYGM